MKTLLVDCYPDDWKPKAESYAALLREFSPAVVTVDYRELGPGSSDLTYDAVVLTGSPTMLAVQPPSPELVGFLRRLVRPVFGICFGHQLLGVAHGAEIGSRKFYEGPGTVRVLEPGGIFEGLPAEIEVFESHKEFLVPESVERIGWQVLAESDYCAVEAMRHRTRPFYSVQFHPERSGEVGLKVVGNFYRRVVGA